ncbi:MAG: hypothetical protein IJS01_07470 [Lentisphaeria bacterium]|nr:hypothetical protein [Lentisphaeria bacterium]
MKRSYFAWGVILLAGGLTATLRADTMIRDAKANIIYQYSNGVMYQGHARENKKLFKYDQRGEIWSMKGKRLAFWKSSENALYPGKGGRPMYIYADKGGHPGSKGAKAVIYIDGRKIYHGHGPGCKLILYPDSPLPTPVALYLAHTITGGKPPAPSDAGKLTVDFATIPYGYYLGAKGEGKILLSLRGNRIFFNDTAKGMPAYTIAGLKVFRGPDTKAEPAFCFAKNGFLYKGAKPAPGNLAMSLDWFNCYAPGKSGTEAIGTLQYVGENILTEGYTKPSPKPDFKGKKVLLSSTLPNNKVPMIMRIFLVYLTQLDPDFKAYAESRK